MKVIGGRLLNGSLMRKGTRGKNRMHGGYSIHTNTHNTNELNYTTGRGRYCCRLLIMQGQSSHAHSFVCVLTCLVVRILAVHIVVHHRLAAVAVRVHSRQHDKRRPSRTEEKEEDGVQRDA